MNLFPAPLGQGIFLRRRDSCAYLYHQAHFVISPYPFSVTLIIYAVLRCLPASYVESMAMQLATAPGAKPYEEWIAQLNASYGLDKGIIAGYFTWLGDFARGNFGDSWKFTVPVIQKCSMT